jgi:NADPH:quinone reductase-like Zn-dependent oxidoreductase
MSYSLLLCRWCGVSAWLALTHRAKLMAGESVLILGATGVTGKLAIRMAKLLGAARVVAAGRNENILSTLHQHGADTTIRLDLPAQEVTDAFAREAGASGFQVVIDYVWDQLSEGNSHAGNIWRARRDSNSRPIAPEAIALSS